MIVMLASLYLCLWVQWQSHSNYYRLGWPILSLQLFPVRKSYSCKESLNYIGILLNWTDFSQLFQLLNSRWKFFKLPRNPFGLFLKIIFEFCFAIFNNFGILFKDRSNFCRPSQSFCVQFDVVFREDVNSYQVEQMFLGSFNLVLWKNKIKFTLEYVIVKIILHFWNL